MLWGKTFAFTCQGKDLVKKEAANRELQIRVDTRTRKTSSTRFDLKFFSRVLKNHKSREASLYPFFFTQKVSTVIFSEGG